MEAAWFLQWELSRLCCHAALILLMPVVSDHFRTQQDRGGVYMIIVEKKGQ